MRSSPGTSRSILRHRGGDERGQGLVEYTLILLLAVTVIIVALPPLGVPIVEIFESIDDPFA